VKLVPYLEDEQGAPTLTARYMYLSYIEYRSLERGPGSTWYNRGIKFQSVAKRYAIPGLVACAASVVYKWYNKETERRGGSLRSSLDPDHNVVVTRHPSGHGSRPTPIPVRCHPLQYGCECGTQSRKPFIKTVRRIRLS